MTILDQSLGHLARSIPGATAVFHKHQLDFCCGGKQSLRQAAATRAVDADALAAELQAIQFSSAAEQEWLNATDVELIEHILTRYHHIHLENNILFDRVDGQSGSVNHG